MKEKVLDLVEKDFAQEKKKKKQYGNEIESFRDVFKMSECVKQDKVTNGVGILFSSQRSLERKENLSRSIS